AKHSDREANSPCFTEGRRRRASVRRQTDSREEGDEEDREEVNRSICQANLDLALGTPGAGQFGSTSRHCIARLGSRQVSDGPRYANTAIQEVLQSVPEARNIEGQAASISRWPRATTAGCSENC